ncbi:MAG TPA: RTX toxin [Myxococcaceae bacterium]
MKKVRFQHTRRSLRKAALLLSALTFGTTACSPQPSAPPQQEQQDNATATFSIKSRDILESSGASRDRSLSSSSLHSAQAFAFSDVTSIRIDVKEKASNNPLYVNFDLITPAPGEWFGEIPFLPKNKALIFSAKAFGASGMLFRGDTEQTLSINEEEIIISLAAANNGQAISIPRIRKITVPSGFGSGQSGNVSFAVEANTGEKLSYEITSEPGSGTFFPTSGTIELLGTTGTFVSQYAPPTVTANTDFEHSVKVTNSTGHSVTTTFRTKVKPPGNTQGVEDAVVLVLFSPVINSLNTSRLTGSGNVLFHASVSDDGPASALTYAWRFAPATGTSYTPAPGFSSATNPTVGTTNPATLANYTTAVQGTITLEVTDGDLKKTTLTYPLSTNQFPDDPVFEGGLTGINSIRAGNSHTCALFNNGAMRCWGLNDYGQLGYENTIDIGDTEKPYTAGDVALVGVGARIALGGKHTCALLDTGLVRCWGNNQYGQLGYNTTEHVGDGEAIASYGYVNLGGIASKIAAGGEHTCALMNNGTVRCWGRNNYGQLGYGDTENIGDNEQPWTAGVVNVGGTVTNIVAGGAHTCALLDNGQVRCWGYNGSGQLGYGNTTPVGDDADPATAGSIDLGGQAMQLSAGKNHTCALLTTGNVRCWGYNGFGQLGYGHYSNIHKPTLTNAGDVEMGGKVLQVATGENHTCALLGSGDIKCWGHGGRGRLGRGTSTASLNLPPLTGVDLDGSSAFQVATGAEHTCALLSTGGARCWGSAFYGQLGYGNKEDIGDDEVASAGGDIQVLAP